MDSCKKKCTRASTIYVAFIIYLKKKKKNKCKEIIQKVERKKCTLLQNLKKSGKIYGINIQYNLIKTQGSSPEEAPISLVTYKPDNVFWTGTKNPAHTLECQVSRHSCGSNGDWQTGKVTQASQVGQLGKHCVSCVSVCLFVCFVCVLFESAPVFWS